MPYTLVTLDERPDLIDETDKMASGGWPEFMLHDPVADQFFGHLYDTFPQYQTVVLDDSGRVIACGNTVPVTWDGTVEGLPLDGWDAMLQLGVANFKANIAPDTLSAVQVVVAKDYLGKGLSQQALQGMRAAARRHNLKALIAPVRPNWKARYPLTPIERYVAWEHTDGGMFDPWLRTHQKLGAIFMRICPTSMTITASVEEWEKWAEMRFPETGSYIIPGALSPLEIDREADTGRYIEPNVWMKHSVA